MEPIDYSVNEQQQPAVQIEYAGFWWRVLAALIDGIVLAVVGMILQLIMGFAGIRKLQPDPNEIERFMRGDEWTIPGIYGVTWTDIIITQLVTILLNWLYFAIMESSSRQATLGKMAIGATVTDMNGDRISFARATGRFFGKYLSALTLGVGYIMAGFTEKKQALHDMVASTLVLRTIR